MAEMRRLEMLAYLDGETVRIYDAVLKTVGQDVKGRLQEFRDMHEEHKRHWTEMGMQGTVSEDMKMMIAEHLRLAQETSDQDHALEALLLVERMNLAELRRATQEQYPQDMARMAQQHYEHEQQHVSYIEQKMPALTGINKAAQGAPTT